jgi:GDPmannose 4,6-dehydratase
MKALITGINGQDGSYLAEFLIQKGYQVMGTLKRNSVAETQTTRLEHIFKNIKLDYVDMNDLSSLTRIISKFKPTEIYHLAAQSHVQISFSTPVYTTSTNAIGTLNLLEAALTVDKDIKIYNAASSEMFGNSVDSDGFQRETTPMNPVSPYGCSKVFSYNICNNYRKAYNMFVSNGILFNHESPRRGSNFVTTKIIRGLINISRNKQTELRLGNLDSYRDWGHAKDYVKAMWLMLQHNTSDNFVVATGETHSVKEVLTYVSEVLELKDIKITQDREYIRPEELNYLKGDSSKIRKLLGWKPDYSFYDVLDDMINHWKQV